MQFVNSKEAKEAKEDGSSGLDRPADAAPAIRAQPPTEVDGRQRGPRDPRTPRTPWVPGGPNDLPRTRALFAGSGAQQLRALLTTAGSAFEVADEMPDLERARRSLIRGVYDIAFVGAGFEEALSFGEAARRARLTWIWVPESDTDEPLDLADLRARSGASAVLGTLELTRETGRELVGLALELVADRAQVRARREDLAARFTLVAEGARDGFWEWEFANNRLRVSDRWLEMLGLEREATSDAESARVVWDAQVTWFDRVSPEDLPGLEEAIRRHVEGSTTHFEREVRMRHADGSWRWIDCRGKAARDADGHPLYLAGSQADISEQKASEGELARRALYDDLTGLAGRALFLDRVAHCLDRARRQGGEAFAVLFLDLDRFKQVNDTWGHRAGDRLLVAAARRIEYCIRPGDTAARLSGDEFAVLLEGIEETQDSLSVAQRLAKELGAPFGLGERQVQISASIGLVLGSSRYDSAEDLLADADTAMYRAKERGPGRYEVAGPLTTAPATQATLEDELRRALRDKEFCLHYQPVFRLDTGRLTSFEALLRWERRDRGVVESIDFIRAAEHAGLLAGLGCWVVTEAARELSVLRRVAPQLEMSVNVSVSELVRPDFARELLASLGDAGLDGAGVSLEIPEEALRQWSDASTRVLEDLRATGLGLEIDDFGAVGSAVALLERLPVRGLKLAGELVRGDLVCGDPVRGDRSDTVRPRDLESVVPRGGAAQRRGRLLGALVALAHDLGLAVTAKGIERDEELARVRALGCERAQGFLLGRPLGSAELEAWIRSSKVI